MSTVSKSETASSAQVDGVIEVKIRGLMMDPVTNMPIVVLKDVNGDAA